MARDLISVSALGKDRSILRKTITRDEILCFLYDPQSKRASAKWKSPQSPRKQKFHQYRSENTVMLEIFFVVQGIVHLQFIPL